MHAFISANGFYYSNVCYHQTVSTWPYFFYVWLNLKFLLGVSFYKLESVNYDKDQSDLSIGWAPTLSCSFYKKKKSLCQRDSDRVN